ncbi:hypothetical protein [Acidisoma sp. 7E03]
MTGGRSLVLPGLALALGLALVAEWLEPPGASAPLGFGHLPQGGEDAAARMPPAQRWADIARERPLFNPDRRPQQSGAPTPGLARLTAIIIAGGARSAIFAGGGAGEKPRILPEGGVLGGYAILHISSDAVELAGASGRVTLHPQFPTAVTPAAAPAAPPPTPSAADYDNEN